jgi:hypothetical protein
MEDESIQTSEINKFRNVLELLRKLPHVDRTYFQDLIIWIINELLAGKEVDLLLLELFQEQKYQRDDLFFVYFNYLLKYYLPANYSAQIDAALKAARAMETEQVSLNKCADAESIVITKMNYHLKVYLLALFQATAQKRKRFLLKISCSSCTCFPFWYLSRKAIGFIARVEVMD